MLSNKYRSKTIIIKDNAYYYIKIGIDCLPVLSTYLSTYSIMTYYIPRNAPMHSS